MLQCWRRTGHLPSFFVPTLGDLTAQESPLPGIGHPMPKNAYAQGSARREGGGGGWLAGRSWIDWCINTWRCVNEVSRCFSLLLFIGISLNSTSQFFFRLPLCECPLALSRLNVCSFVSKARVFFAGNFNCNLTSWLILLFSRYTYAIAPQFIFCPSLFMGWDCVPNSFDLNIHARKLQKPSSALKTSFSIVQYNLLA